MFKMFYFSNEEMWLIEATDLQTNPLTVSILLTYRRHVKSHQADCNHNMRHEHAWGYMKKKWNRHALQTCIHVTGRGGNHWLWQTWEILLKWGKIISLGSNKWQRRCLLYSAVISSHLVAGSLLWYYWNGTYCHFKVCKGSTTDL